MLSFSKQSCRKSCRCLSCGEEREEQWGVSKSSRRGIEHRCGRSSSSPKTVPWRIPSPKAFSCRQKHLLRAWPHPTKTRLLCQKEHGRHCFGRMGKPGCQNHTFSSSPHVAVGLPRRSHHIPPKGSPHHPPSSSIGATPPATIIALRVCHSLDLSFTSVLPLFSITLFHSNFGEIRWRC